MLRIMETAGERSLSPSTLLLRLSTPRQTLFALFLRPKSNPPSLSPFKFLQAACLTERHSFRAKFPTWKAGVQISSTVRSVATLCFAITAVSCSIVDTLEINDDGSQPVGREENPAFSKHVAECVYDFDEQRV